jgi:hypothetical protein
MRAVLLLACLGVGCGQGLEPVEVGLPPLTSVAAVGPERICCEDAVTVVTVDVDERYSDSLYYARIEADDATAVHVRNSIGGKDFEETSSIVGGAYVLVPGGPLEVEIRPGPCSGETRSVRIHVVQERPARNEASQYKRAAIGSKTIPIVECDPPGAPRPGPGTVVYDSVVENPQIPFVVEQFGTIPGPLAVLPGGVPGDGALALVDMATGGLLSTFLASGFGNPPQHLPVLWFDPMAPPGMTYGIETLDLRAAFDNGWGLKKFKPQASDINVTRDDDYGLALEFIRTIPSTRQVQYVDSSGVTTYFESFHFPAGLVPVSADYDYETDLWYLVLIDPDDGNRTFLYVSDGSTMVPVHETGFGGTSVRIGSSALVVAHEESETISVFKRDADDVFVHAFDIDDAGPVRSVLSRRNGENTVLAWAYGTGLRVVVVDADCNLKVDESFLPPVGMDRVNGLAWHRVNGLYGTGALGSQGKCFFMEDYVEELDLDECARFQSLFDVDVR